MKIRFHGNGFIQVELNSLTRLHMWSPNFPATRVKNAQIHDHRFWFSSRVLMGKLHHDTYAVEIDEGCPHGLYQTHGHSKVAPLEKINNCAVRRIARAIFCEGDDYEFGGPGMFHETYAEETTVTVITKTKVEPGYHARIVAINDHSPDHAFENQPDDQKLRAEVEKIWRYLSWKY